MGTLITFKDRDPSDYTNKQIVEVFRTCEDPDVDLMVSNGQIVSAHRVILSMYSKYLRRSLSVSNPGPKLILPLKQFSLITIQHVVELFYYGKTQVPTSIKGQLIKALTFLEVDYYIPSNHRVSNAAMANTQMVTKPSEAIKTTATPLNAKVLGVKPMPLQKKPNAEQQPKTNGVTKPKLVEQPGQSTKPLENANLAPVKNSSPPVTEKSNVPHDATTPATVTPLDKGAPLSMENNQSLVQSAEALKTLEIVESTPLPEISSGNMPIGSSHTKEATPATEVEKVDENITARLLKYDVDKAAAQIHSQVNALMKEIDVDLEDYDDMEI